MKNNSKVDDYISNFPTEVQEKLQTVRKTIKEIAPDAEESFSYGLAAFNLNGKPLVYIGGFKDHIGFFPTGEGVEFFKDKIKNYKTSKGTIQFQLDHLLPLDLIKAIVKHRLEQVDHKS